MTHVINIKLRQGLLMFIIFHRICCKLLVSTKIEDKICV